jgi:two-component system, OmpR family, response regulator
LAGRSIVCALHVGPTAMDSNSAIPRILVIDDERTMLRLLEVALQKNGYSVVTASSGEEGLAQAAAWPPDLIILDVMMPQMDGWTVIKHLRAMSQCALVPVVFLTALDSSTNRIRGFQLGADDFMAKPISPEELNLRVAKALRIHHHLEAGLIAQTRAVSPRDEPGVRGTFDQLGLAPLLTILEMERKTGVLRAERLDQSREAAIALRRGMVVRARVAGGTPLHDAPAVHAMLSWPDGRFHFRATEVGPPFEMDVSPAWLLLESARLSDEEEQLAEAQRFVSDALGPLDEG